MKNIQESTEHPIDYTTLPYDRLLSLIISGCKFKYLSYDNKRAIQEYRTNEEYLKAHKRIPNPKSWDIPSRLKEKYKTERIGKLREIHFDPSGKVRKVKIGAKYAKTYTMKDFGVNVFPLVYL